MYKLNSKRKEALASLVKSLNHRLQITEEQAEEIFKDYNLAGVEKDGKTIGCLMSKENEVHVGIEPEHHGKWYSKRIFRQFIEPIVDKYGSAISRTTEDNHLGMDFLTRLGFKKKGDWYVYTR
jgi:GNAT superfamily N-acetyltransferase